MKKTNAMRTLDRAKIEYTILEYEHDENEIDGISVAHKLNKNPDSVFKTLVLKGAHQYYVALVPVHEHLDLKKTARAFNEKSLQMIAVKDLNAITGYVRGACSPFAMKKEFPLVIDSKALEHATIVMSSGSFGLQLEMDPKDFITVRKAQTDDIIMSHSDN